MGILDRFIDKVATETAKKVPQPSYTVPAKIADTPANQDPPEWAVNLSEDLGKVTGALRQMALSDELRKDVIQANDRMSRERRQIHEKFDALQQFVETGKSCADCRATRRIILERMKDVIHKNNHIQNDSVDAGNGYATRTAAFNAGWELAFGHLKNILVEIEKSI